jgi:hypothetical protein
MVKVGEYYKSRDDGDILEIWSVKDYKFMTIIHEDINSAWGKTPDSYITWDECEYENFYKEYKLVKYINTPLYKILNN